MQPKFKVGESVRFTGGTFTLTYPDKRVEYTLKGRVGVIKEVINVLLSHSYRVDVEIDGKQRQVFATEKDLESGRIGTPFSSMIEDIEKMARNACLSAIIDKSLKDMKHVIDLFEKGKEFGKDCTVTYEEKDGRILIKNQQEYAKQPESKMTKERCIKLLESYRAEREKVAKGRKFERCLRDGVVNEAIERAIELLKEGGK